MASVERRHVFVSGVVQGVFFRESTRRVAADVGVNGWVRNLPDGRVEAVFEGTADAVDVAVTHCRTGPPGSRVDAIEVSAEVAEHLDGFVIHPTPPRAPASDLTHDA